MAENKFINELIELYKKKDLDEKIKGLVSSRQGLVKLSKKIEVKPIKEPEKLVEEKKEVVEEVVEVIIPEVSQEVVQEEVVQEEVVAPVEVKKETTINTPAGVVLVKTEGDGTKPVRERKFLQRPTPTQTTQEKKREFRPNNDRLDKNKKPTGDVRTANNNKQGQKPGGFKQGTGVMPVVQDFIPKEGKNFASNSQKKKTNQKSYEDKKAPNKRALAKEQLNNRRFDEDESGYRKVRKQKKNSNDSVNTIKIEHAIITKEEIAIKELSEKIGTSAVEITKLLFKDGIMKTINDSLTFDEAAYIAAEVGVELELKMEKSAEEKLSEQFNQEMQDQSLLIKRPPIVTVMGHVDHGKTSILDRIRSASVASGEAGGITQHIGAYTVSVGGEQITFLDTPGHAAFTSMRARGAQITDIAVLVVAADDGIMPQTIEAISHAKSAGVPFIIAANKIDKAHADLDRVRQQLTEHEILVEEWGGDVILVPVSAKTGEGIDKLLESILLIAELKELKANPDGAAKGCVVEAKLDKGRGPVANIIVQNGTLKTGDDVVIGTVIGRVRAMMDDKGRTVKEAGPSMPVSIMGLDDVPNAGDAVYAVRGGDKDKLLKMVAEERRNKEKRERDKLPGDIDIFQKMAEGDLENLNIIIKADVQGSVEAVKDSLLKLSNEEVRVTVVHAAVGAINETDVTLAESANAIIIGFNVRPDSKAKAIAEKSKVSVKLYRIIYEAIEDVENAMKGLLVPKFQDVYMGKAEVKQTFKIKGVGTIAGCVVTEGKIVRQGKLMIYRDDVKFCEGNVQTLKHYKDEVKEVGAGTECGIAIQDFDDIKVGDFIECYIQEEVK